MLSEQVDQLLSNVRPTNLLSAEHLLMLTSLFSKPFALTKNKQLCHGPIFYVQYVQANLYKYVLNMYFHVTTYYFLN